MSEITITGTNYHITAWKLNDDTWAVQGEYDECAYWKVVARHQL